MGRSLVAVEAPGIALSPLEGTGDRLDTRLALSLEPELLTASIADLQQQPLPPLMASYPDSSGLNLQLAVELDYADLNRSVTERLSGASLEIAGQRSGIEAIALGGQGQNLRVDATLNGHAAGHAALLAELIFEPETQQIKLKNLDYIYQPEHPWLQAEENLFRGYILKMLEAAANQKIQQLTNQGKERLLAMIRKITPDGLTIEMDALQMREVQLHIAANAIKLTGVLSGEILLEFH